MRVMSDVTWLMFAIPLLVLLVFGLVIGIIVVAGRPRPLLGLGPAPGVTADGRWRAKVMEGNLLARIGWASPSGLFIVERGELSFQPDGAAEPRWSVPCRQVAVRDNSSPLLFSPWVLLWLPGGTMRCQVSREHINSFVTNDPKTWREQGYRREFAQCLAANGARLV